MFPILNVRMGKMARNGLIIHEEQDMTIWVKVLKNGPSKICGRKHLKNLK